MPAVSIVLINWNGVADTLECLGSLRELAYGDYHVIVVDNGSEESCSAAVASQFPEVEVIESAVNLGFTGGCNLGIRRALELNADYVWLLNNDTVAAPEALTELVRVAESDMTYGIVGSKIYFWGGQEVIDHAGCRWDEERCQPVHIGCGERDHGQYDEVRSVLFVDGCSMLVKRAVIDTVGLLDDAYFAYLEDLDWCTRARGEGWDVRYAPGSVIHHKRGTVAEPAPYQHYLYARNLLRYTSRHRPDLVPKTIRKLVLNGLIVPGLRGRLAPFLPISRGIRDWVVDEIKELIGSRARRSPCGRKHGNS